MSEKSVVKKNLSAKKVIDTIETICYMYENGGKTLKEAEKYIGMIYKFSHLFSKCKNRHEDWRKEYYQFSRRFKEEL